MSYTHLYGGWLPRTASYRATVVHTHVNEEEHPDVTYEDNGVLKDKSLTVHLVLMATFDHEPTEREVHDALPQRFRSSMLDDWDDELDDEDETP